MKKTILKVIALHCIASLALVARSDSDSDKDKADSTTTTKKAAEETSMKDKTIVDIAVANPDFSTLVAAVQAADLGDLLATEGTFTVFAPTNEAFAKIDKATLDTLLANKAELTKVLTYHAVATAAVMSSDLTDGQVITTAEGSKLTIGVKDGKVTVTTDAGVTANVVTADIEGSNGVIHAIDTVLLPKNLAL